MGLIWKAMLFGCSKRIFAQSNKILKVPPIESNDIAIEDTSGKDQFISVLWQKSLSKVIYNHEIWGNEKNFTETVDMDDPFNPNKYGLSDNKGDEVVNGAWHKKQCRNARR